MKSFFYSFIVLLFFKGSLLSQEIALTTEIQNKNGKVYYNGSPYTGKVYEYNQNAATKCSCTIEANYTKGILDGSYKSWYVTGQEKYMGLYDNGKMEGKHSSWTANGTKEFEKWYVKDRMVKQLLFYPSGRKKELKEFENSANNVFTYIKKHLVYLDNEANTIKAEANYLNNKPHGKQLAYFDNGSINEEKNYKYGVLVSSFQNYEDGTTQKEKITAINSDLFKKEEYYENGKPKEVGFLNKEQKKDSVWSTYLIDGSKNTETAYQNDSVTRKGFYKDEKPNGEWVYYYKKGEEQRRVVYENGENVSEAYFKTKHLIKEQYKSSGYKGVYFYEEPQTNTLQYITLLADNSERNGNNGIVYYNLIKEVEERLNPISITSKFNNETIEYIIQISNIRVDTKESTYQTTSGSEKGYDAFIYFTIDLLNPDQKSLFKKEYKINKSDKLLSSLFNTLAKTYSRSPKEAFNRTVKEIDISDFLMKYFPILADMSKRKK
ncbi:MAG: hypothetical protein R2776_07040 [Flavobacteriaceae bacterium]|nr:hypothetical protein [Flavobacteriaceae bacterium]